MENYQIIPDVLDYVPRYVAVVKFEDQIEMQLGNELTPTQVREVPSLLQWPVEFGGHFTVMLTDPDSPSRSNPAYRELLHWLVVNVPGNDLNQGETVVGYVGSAPEEGTGLHRYLLTVHQQPDVFDVDLLRNIYHGPYGRVKFSTRNFVTKYGLRSIPIAGNFFQAQLCDSVQLEQGQQLSDAMKSHQIVPDLIGQTPTLVAEVKYDKYVKMNFGNMLTIQQIENVPSVSWKSEPSIFYSLCLIDPDTPTRLDPKFRSTLHWLIVNIPGNDLSKGQTLAQYMSTSATTNNSGLHRILLLVYRQRNRITPQERMITAESMSGRQRFQIRDFAARYQLGQALAGNFCQIQHSDYPVLSQALNDY